MIRFSLNDYNVTSQHLAFILQENLCGTNAHLPGPSFYLKCFVGHNSEIIAFRIISPCLATAPCHDEQVFKICFGVDTFNTFWVMGYIKVFERRRQQSR